MIVRTLQRKLEDLSSRFPVMFLTGPRQSGKTTLARATFPDWTYHSMEDLQVREEAIDDPLGFLERLAGLDGIILDEAQHTPELFSYLQRFVDEKRSGPVLLTGSQNFLLSERISQTLAGRVAILELLPFSRAELDGRSPRYPEQLGTCLEEGELGTDLALERALFEGGFPPIHDRDIDALDWFVGYVRTYVERDVRSLRNIGDLDTFSRFLRLCAGRAGQLLNLSSLGADAGIDHTTVKTWISVLRASYVVTLLQPHHVNFRKRLVKTPKLYFYDSGLLCHLLGLRQMSDVLVHPLRGPIFENLVVTELLKVFHHHGEPPPVYFWRDRSGHEIDILVDLGSRQIPIEAKAGRTVYRDAFKGLSYYGQLSGINGGVLVYGGDECYMRSGHVVQTWRTIT